MKCHTHKETDAVATCVHCGKALCRTCAAPSPSGRLVCSPGCAAASKQMEDVITSIRHQATRSAHVTAYFSFGLAVVFTLFAVASCFDVHSWPLTIFVGAGGVGFFLAGIGYYRRVAKRNREPGAA